MFRLVLCLVFITLRAEANVPETENPEIRLSYTYTKEENYTVFKDKPLKIIIDNVYARYVWCSNTYRKNLSLTTEVEKFVPETEFSAIDINILHITKVTAEMSTTWVCKILQEYHGSHAYTYKNRTYTAKDLYFTLHVKGARAVILTANTRSLTQVTTNLTVNYDGEVNYTYEDGEGFPMNFSCQKAEAKRNLDTLHLEYYNAEGILLFQTKPRETPHIFRSVLKSNNDKYYLDCIRTARDPDREYRYRTTFFKRDLHADAVQHAVILFVNGQKISTLLNDNSNDDYIFGYIDGEVLNVTCRKSDVNLSGSLTFRYDKETAHHVSKALRSQSEAVISLNISTLAVEHKSLSCSINNADVEKPNARLLFVSEVPCNDIRIRGLPRNNILYQYTNDEYLWTIEYQYSVNDTLNLTCVSNADSHLSRQPSQYANPFLWKFEGYQRFITFASPAIRTSEQIRFSEIPFTKILNATHNGTKIKCIYFPNKVHSHINNRVEIILRLKPKLEENESVTVETSTHSYTLVYCLTAAGVSVIIILVILYWTVKKSCCCIRSSSQELPSVPTPTPNPATVYYENLLSVFQPINEREAAELENHYEEIQ